MKPMKILFTHSKNVLLEMQSKILLHTKNYSVKSISLQITQITILGYSNDKNIYIVKNIILIG